MNPTVRQAQSDSSVPRLTFGIYPGSATGEGPLLFAGPVDDPVRIQAALDQLQPAGHPFLVRGYLHYVGAGTIRSMTPVAMEQYACNGRQLDLVLCYRSTDGDMADWTQFIRRIIRQYGDVLAKIQITEEPNNPDTATGGDGSSPNVYQAIVDGVVAAKDEAQQLGYPLQVGFNTAVSWQTEFWVHLAELGGQSFIDALDYIGFDFFPDVFRPLPPGPDGASLSLRDAVSAVLTSHRMVNLPAGKIPATLPLHITENGWPTTNGRTEAHQAEVLETIVRTVDGLRSELNITHYEFFDLRDTNSTNPSDFQFGLLRDNYSPKPAFACYQQLIAELGI